MTRLDLTLENGKITDYRHRLIEISQEIAPDPEAAELVQTAMQLYREELEAVVGETCAPLDRGLNLESTMDNLLLSMLLEHTGAQMAFSNGWRYGDPILPCPICANDFYNMVPMNPPVSTVEITGAELRTMLEENLENTFSRESFKQMDGYTKRSMGIRFFFKIENPPLKRIHKEFVGE